MEAIKHKNPQFASIWDPEQKDLIKELDKILRKAARFVKNCFGRTQSISKLLEELNWEPLLIRRFRARHSFLKKLRTETFRGNTENIILTLNHISRSERSDKIHEIRCRTVTFKYSFFPHTISEHNKIEVLKEGNT
jgi:hypothetical protein